MEPLCRRVSQPERVRHWDNFDTLKRITIEKSLRLDFLATNNKAQHKALLIGVVMVKKIGRHSSGDIFRFKIGRQTN